jgi:DNA-binding XRE family transcriptional regulator
MDKRTAIMDIVRDYRQGQSNGRPYSHGDMAIDLSKNDFSVSRQTLWLWQSGKVQPRLETLLLMTVAFPAEVDWRHQMALDLMAACRPEEYSPVSEIGRRVLAEPAPQS